MCGAKQIKAVTCRSSDMISDGCNLWLEWLLRQNHLELIERVLWPSRAAERAASIWFAKVPKVFQGRPWLFSSFCLFSSVQPDHSLNIVSFQGSKMLEASAGLRSVSQSCPLAPHDGGILCKDLIFADFGTFWYPACVGPRWAPLWPAGWMSPGKTSHHSRSLPFSGYRHKDCVNLG